MLKDVKDFITCLDEKVENLSWEIVFGNQIRTFLNNYSITIEKSYACDTIEYVIVIEKNRCSGTNPIVIGNEFLYETSTNLISQIYKRGLDIAISNSLDFKEAIKELKEI